MLSRTTNQTHTPAAATPVAAAGLRLRPAENPILRPRGGSTAAGITGDRTMRRAAGKRELLHLLHVSNAAKQLERLPAEGESIHCVMRGNYHAWDLIPAALQLAAPATIERLYVATLGFNDANARELVGLLDAGRIRRVTFLCSAYFRDASAETYRPLAEQLLARGQRVAAIRTHAKIQAYTLTDGRAIAIESSANLRSCRNIEQFCMTADRALFDFHAAWMDEVFAQWPDGKQPPPDPPAHPKRRPH
jgi:hypothetical protein